MQQNKENLIGNQFPSNILKSAKSLGYITKYQNHIFQLMKPDEIRKSEKKIYSQELQKVKTIKKEKVEQKINSEQEKHVQISNKSQENSHIISSQNSFDISMDKSQYKKQDYQKLLKKLIAKEQQLKNDKQYLPHEPKEKSNLQNFLTPESSKRSNKINPPKSPYKVSPPFQFNNSMIQRLQNNSGTNFTSIKRSQYLQQPLKVDSPELSKSKQVTPRKLQLSNNESCNNNKNIKQDLLKQSFQNEISSQTFSQTNEQSIQGSPKQNNKDIMGIIQDKIKNYQQKKTANKLKQVIKIKKNNEAKKSDPVFYKLFQQIKQEKFDYSNDETNLSSSKLSQCSKIDQCYKNQQNQIKISIDLNSQKSQQKCIGQQNNLKFIESHKKNSQGQQNINKLQNQYKIQRKFDNNDHFNSIQFLKTQNYIVSPIHTCRDVILTERQQTQYGRKYK
ncbi:hypothetical protein PPERSA_07538 [Pseudocohnilembus persalinus]|uniref:Uncharacterized protein n=1 Tax=Pseudocohnilembus persalinus TaxID=266149 RepID=A0A0V0QZR2_PSEPJ|nr:hypothetical protein PPERSA_07538 [Pseudocohnilembus persalinus]|eukprot:KRX07788.1 hypothetical protein PPERSA_07538 [Pseudocohnilembus persalinus]